jgi:hypothetical protein
VLSAVAGPGRGRLGTGGKRPASSRVCNIPKIGDMIGGGITVACGQHAVAASDGAVAGASVGCGGANVFSRYRRHAGHSND